MTCATRQRNRSAEALASLTAEHKDNVRRDILYTLEWTEGSTDERLCRHIGIAGDTLRPRRRELVGAGLVEDSGETRATNSGRKATVWRLTDAGRERLREITGGTES